MPACQLAAGKHRAGALSLGMSSGDRANVMHSLRKLTMNWLNKNAIHDKARQRPSQGYP